MKEKTSLNGKIIKIHSDFVYVKSDDIVFECKIRERLKKEKTEIFVGDRVVIEEANLETRQAAIVSVMDRKNFITRPSVANIDQIIVVASLSEPEPDFVQLNRYLCHAKLNGITALICINKMDLKNKKDAMPEKICSIYEPLRYKVIFTSAMDGAGIKSLHEHLSGKVSVLAGMSGVGKSSILNTLCPGFNLRTQNVSAKTGKGVHTTRHTELLEIQVPESEKTFEIADTPGFSCLRFDNILPREVINLFDEIKTFSEECYFSDCLHLNEEKCNVTKNIDKIERSRYLSYKNFVEEAFEYKKRIEATSKKKEAFVKTIDTSGKEKTRIVKVGSKAREGSRKKNKQEINNILFSEDIYYNNNELE